jgi:hypothetical protein
MGQRRAGALGLAVDDWRHSELGRRWRCTVGGATGGGAATALLAEGAGEETVAVVVAAVEGWP